MRYPTLELGAGDLRDPDIDKYNDIKDLKGLHYVCDARSIPEEDETFSMVTSNHLIEHLDEQGQRELLKECYRLLVPGGMVFLWTPDLDWMDRSVASGEISREWYETLKKGKGDEDYDRHKKLLRAGDGELEGMMDEAGFRVVSVKEVGGSVEAVGVKQDV